jgi:hypothetical protein
VPACCSAHRPAARRATAVRAFVGLIGLRLSQTRWNRYERRLVLGVLAAGGLLLGSSAGPAPVSFAQLIRQAAPSVVCVRRGPVPWTGCRSVT